MENTQKITFRSKGNPRAALFTPPYLHDVEAMRRHPEYEEVKVDAAGAVTEVVVQFEDSIHRPTISTTPANAPAKPKKAKK